MAYLRIKIVGGPNQRTDYHVNATPELFYQYKGSMLLKIVDSNITTPTKRALPNFRDVIISEGELFLLPPNTPHNPVRFANTVGIVVELPRLKGKPDMLRWYCKTDGCGEVVYEEAFEAVDLGTQLKEVVERVKADEGKRKCKRCGAVADMVHKDLKAP
jgi:3-hydroxyanthranilate 3,4-dioxygenase